MPSSEQFRNEFQSMISTILPPEQMRSVMKAFDMTIDRYSVSRKQTEIIPSGGIPELVKWYISSKAVENVSKGTLKQYNYQLSKFFSSVRKAVQDINANDIRLYLYGFKQHRNASDRYIESIRITLNGFFAWLVRNDYLFKNPCEKIERIRFQEKKREPLTAYELEVFRYNCVNAREKALVDFLFSSGCRISECADIRLSDIDLQNRSAVIRHGKGNKQRTIYINAEAELSIRKYLESRDDGSDALFVSDRKPHQPLKSRALENVIGKIGERAGMHVYPHRLRHTFATSGLRGGMPIERLQALMGHVSPSTTLIYAKLDNDDLKREHSRIYA